MSTGSGQETLATGTMSRRRFLQLSAGTLIVGASLAPELAWAGRSKPELVEKKLSLFNYHTGERIKTVYWEKGEYIPDALQEINHVLRDRRTDEVIDIDPKLLDLLYQYCGQNLGRLFGNNTIVAKGFVLRAGFFQTQPVS